MLKGLIFLVFIPSITFALIDQKIRIAVLDLEPMEGVSSNRAQALSEILRTEIAGTGVFEVIERGQIVKQMEEAKFQLSGLTSDSDINGRIELGKVLGIKRAIIGSIIEIEGTITINVRLINMETGNIDIPQSFYTSKDKVVFEMKDIAKAISDKANLEMIQINAADIETLIASEDFEKAKEKLEIYIKQSGKNTKSQELVVKINKGLAKNKYNQSKESYGKGDLDTAKTVIEEAQKLDPENKDYAAFSVIIQNALNNKKNEEESKSFWLNRGSNMKYGGLDIFTAKFNGLNKTMAEQFPMLIGAGGNLQLPMGKYATLYNKFSYIGLLGNTPKDLPSYLQKMSIMEMIYNGGLRLHLMMFTIVDFYVQGGVNYTYYQESLQDDKYSFNAELNGWGFEAGGGIKGMITTSFGLYAEVMYEGIQLSKTDMSGFQINAGIFLGIF